MDSVGRGGGGGALLLWPRICLPECSRWRSCGSPKQHRAFSACTRQRHKGPGQSNKAVEGSYREHGDDAVVVEAHGDGPGLCVQGQDHDPDDAEEGDEGTLVVG